MPRHTAGAVPRYPLDHRIVNRVQIERVHPGDYRRQSVAKRRRARCFNHGLAHIRTRHHLAQSRNTRIGLHAHDQAILRAIGCLLNFGQPQVNGFDMCNFHREYVRWKFSHKRHKNTKGVQAIAQFKGTKGERQDVRRKT